MDEIRFRKNTGFTLLELMIVVLILSMLLAIAMPSFYNARETSRTQSCVANLWEINSAKMQYVMANKLEPTDTCTMTDLVGPDRYIKAAPVCPLGGDYVLNDFNTSPACSIGAHGAGEFAFGGKYYHGLP